MPRDEFNQKIKEKLAKRVGYLCSNPSCKMFTVGPHTNPNKSINIGVAAHITAASEGGPRFNQDYTREERKSTINGIWLCQNCAKLIDNDIRKYSVELLIEWKMVAEKNALFQIEKQNLYSNVTQTLKIKEVSDLEKLWNERFKYLRETHGRGVSSLEQFWNEICYINAWNPTPIEIAERIMDYNFWIFSGRSGNGKTMFLLTLIKELINLKTERDIFILEPEAFSNIENNPVLDNSIIFIDSPPISKSTMDIFLKSAQSAKNHNSLVIISLSQDLAFEIYENLFKNDILVNYPIYIDKAVNREKILFETIKKLFDRWDIKWDTSEFSNIEQVISLILRRMTEINVQQELLFIVENLEPFRFNKKLFSSSEIEKLLEPTKNSVNILVKLVESKENFLKSFFLLKYFLDWMKEEYYLNGLNAVPISINKDGILEAIASIYHIQNFEIILTKSRLFNYYNGEVYIFDESGFGGRVLKDYLSVVQPQLIPHQEDLLQVNNKLKTIYKKMVTKGEKNFGILFDMIKLKIINKIPEVDFNLIVDQICGFPKNSPIMDYTNYYLSIIAYNYLGNDIEKTIQYYNVILRINPNDVETRINIAPLLGLIGKSEDAESHFKYILMREPKSFAALFNFGSYLFFT